MSPLPQELRTLDTADLSTMNEGEVQAKLTTLDLSSLSVADIKSLKNPVLKAALMDLVRRGMDLAASHQNHGSHGDHSTASERFLELDFLRRFARGER
jgi:hypothetical protein